MPHHTHVYDYTLLFIKMTKKCCVIWFKFNELDLSYHDKRLYYNLYNIWPILDEISIGTILFSTRSWQPPEKCQSRHIAIVIYGDQSRIPSPSVKYFSTMRTWILIAISLKRRAPMSDVLIQFSVSLQSNKKASPLRNKEITGNYQHYQPTGVFPKCNRNSVNSIIFFTYAQKCQYWYFRLYYMKTKNSSDKMLPPVGIEPRPPKTILSTLFWHVLLRRSLNFCSCTTWYLDLDGFKGNQ